MTLIASILLSVIVAAGQPDVSSRITSAAIAHFDSLMTGRAVSWTIDIKRIPQLTGENVTVYEVEDNERDVTPRGASICWVNAVIDGRERRIPVSISIRPIELVPVARREIKPRTTLADSMILWQARDTEKLGSARLPTPEDLRNYWAKVSIPEGTIVTMKRLQREPVVIAGTKVTLIGRRGLVEVKTVGKALEDGLSGERIKVVNSSSRRRLSGTVLSEGLVLVE